MNNGRTITIKKVNAMLNKAGPEYFKISHSNIISIEERLAMKQTILWNNLPFSYRDSHEYVGKTPIYLPINNKLCSIYKRNICLYIYGCIYAMFARIESSKFVPSNLVSCIN